MNLQRQAAAARRRGAADPRRPHRRRQVRLDVPGADSAHAGCAPGRHRRPLARPAACRNLERVGWEPQRVQAASAWTQHCATATPMSATTGRRWCGTRRSTSSSNAQAHPIAAVDHCLEAFAQGKHVVNVTVEADAFCGPLLARKAPPHGVVYSLAFGDQPALICDLVDWARTCGFPVVAAGRGHKWLPHFSAESTPEDGLGLLRTDTRAGRTRRAESRRCSTVSSTAPSRRSRCTAVSNATGLAVPSDGLLYPPASVEDIPFVTRPHQPRAGCWRHKGMVEVISSLEKPTAARSRTTSGWGSGSPSRARPTTSATASRSTTLTPIRAGATSRCTSAGT